MDTGDTGSIQKNKGTYRIQEIQC